MFFETTSDFVQESINWIAVTIFVQPEHEDQVAAAFKFPVVRLLRVSDGYDYRDLDDIDERI